MNYRVFDRDYNFKTSGYQRLSDAPKESGNNVAHEKLSTQINITEAGFVYIYLSNEETTPVEVFFDDLKVTQVKSPVVQVEDYYPFGLSFNEYGRESSIYNKYQYNGKEIQRELGLEWLDYGARTYNAAICRWFACDPLAEKYHNISPYVYVANNPIKFIDPDGKKIIVPNVGDQSRILKMINSQAFGAFAFNKNGELYLTRWNNNKGSTYYSQRLIAGMLAKETITIKMGGAYVDKEGNIRSVDTQKYGSEEEKNGSMGGGVTEQKGKIKNGVLVEKEAEVTISGNPNPNTDLKDEQGNTLTDTPADILMHELVGHAIRFIVGKDTGNAVKNENKVRGQLKKKKRAAEPEHVE